eukprot:TRINITY_DN51_c1_g1_i1.p1 TRINITY_DN51_c1_g1~~TRINITY_DN51_c1_g1_i1.p1  ORF type:complete len:716 (+),score=115.09 TRINITY_DN51_c1_g1_i1:70-2217(+)
MEEIEDNFYELLVKVNNIFELILTCIVALSFAVVIYRLFIVESKRNVKIHSQVISGRQLSDEEIRSLYNLFITFFINEYKTFEIFKEYIRSGVTCLLFYTTHEKKLIGFIILNTHEYYLDKQFFRVVQGDFFGLSSEHRNNYLPILTLVKYCFLHRLRYPFSPMYYFFITYSYRSYLSFGRTIGNYWPRHSTPTPPREKKILDFLGKKAAEGWGQYSEDTCVILQKAKGESGRMALCLSEPRTLTKTIEFFFQLDPGFRSGDCLCVLCEISFSNFAKGIWKVFKRWRSAPIGKQLAKLNSEVSVSDNRNKEQPPVAIGKANRVGDHKIHTEEAAEFTIEVNHLDQTELLRRLKFSRKNINFLRQWPSLSLDVDYIQELLDYWQHSYDWSKHEKELNKYPQYRIKIENTFIHFFHVQSSRSNALPLLLLHGFPSSPYEFLKTIPLLTEPDDESAPAFHVICPSLPGCGWSEKPAPNSDARDIAILLGKLMTSIDYHMYAAHGTGWGSLVASQLGVVYPANCVAVHLGTPIPNLKSKNGLLQKLKKYLMIPLFFNKLEQEQIQSFNETQYMANFEVDGNLVFGLHDSPVALTTFFIEKLRNLTDCKGDLETILTKDEIITHICIFWFTQTISSSLRLYSNSTANFKKWPPHKVILIPVGVSIFPKQMTLPKSYSGDIYGSSNLKWSYRKKGGYFPALEDPTGLAEEIQSFFASFVKT